MGGRFSFFGRCSGATPASDESNSTVREAYKVVSVRGNLNEGSFQHIEPAGPSKALNQNVNLKFYHSRNFHYFSLPYHFV